MLNFTKMNDKQSKLVAELDAFFAKTYEDYDKKEKIVTRQQLRDAHGELREGRKASPHFITRNNMCKVREAGETSHGLYTLKPFFRAKPTKKVAPAAE